MTTETVAVRPAAAAPELPADLWLEIAARVDQYDRLAFSMVSKTFHKAMHEFTKAKYRTVGFYTDLRRKTMMAKPPCFSEDWFRWWFVGFQENRREGRPNSVGLRCGEVRRYFHESDMLEVASVVGLVDVLSWMKRSFVTFVGDAVARAASAAGHLHVLWWLKREGWCFTEQCAGFAARLGRFEVLKWLRREGCEFAVGCCQRAAQGGHLHILKWLRSLDPPCPWDASTFCRAVRIQDFEMLKYLHAEGCPMDGGAFSFAASHGNLEMLEWLYNIGCPHSHCDGTFAAKGGHIHVLEWMDENNIANLGERTCIFAAKAGHLHVLKWLRSRDPPCRWCAKTPEAAILGGHISCLEWAIENGCPWDKESTSAAAHMGDLGTLKWLREHRNTPCPWEECTCYEAARHGHLEVLKYARSKGCKWCEETMRDAAEMNHLHILKWARAQRSPCPWDEEVCALAAKEGNLEVLKWLRAQNPPCPWNERTPMYAAIQGYLDVLKWSINNGCDVDLVECEAVAREAEQAHIVRWINGGANKRPCRLGAAVQWLDEMLVGDFADVFMEQVNEVDEEDEHEKQE